MISVKLHWNFVDGFSWVWVEYEGFSLSASHIVLGHPIMWKRDCSASCIFVLFFSLDFPEILNKPSTLRAGKPNCVLNSNYKVDKFELDYLKKVQLYHKLFFYFISCFDYLIFNLRFKLPLFLKWSVITLLVTSEMSIICNWDISIKDEY